MVASDLLLREVDVSEADKPVPCKRRRGPVPRGRLLLSSASALGGHPTHEKRAVRRDLFGHFGLEIARGQQGGLGPVVVRIQAST